MAKLTMPPAQTHQATCVALGPRAVLIEGPSGSGKTSLALELIDRGAVLVGDDGVVLDGTGKTLIVRPHPRTQGLIEVRNLGLLPEPFRAIATVSLLVTLDTEAPRYIEAPDRCLLFGHAIPRVRLWPHAGPLAIKVERALTAYGLPEPHDP